MEKITDAKVVLASQHTDIFLIILPRNMFTRKQFISQESASIVSRLLAVCEIFSSLSPLWTNNKNSDNYPYPYSLLSPKLIIDDTQFMGHHFKENDVSTVTV